MNAPCPGDPVPGPAVDVLIESPRWEAMPDAEQIVRRAIAQAAAKVVLHRREAELSVLLCDDAVITGLNARWRRQERPTNVLSFPALPRPEPPIPLGDIAIAYETMTGEAAEQGKPAADHLAHLAVHGFLHLLGYDHEIDDEAERMERLEREILARIDIPDPYALPDAEA